MKAYITNVSTKATGVLARVDVSDYQHIESAQVIASIRDEDYRAQVDAAGCAKRGRARFAELARQQAAADSKILQAKAAVHAADSQILAEQAGVSAAEAAVHISEAEWVSAKAVFENATQELDRQEALYLEKAATL